MGAAAEKQEILRPAGWYERQQLSAVQGDYRLSGGIADAYLWQPPLAGDECEMCRYRAAGQKPATPVGSEMQSADWTPLSANAIKQ